MTDKPFTLNPTQAEAVAIYTGMMLNSNGLTRCIIRLTRTLAKLFNPNALKDLHNLELLRNRLITHGLEYDHRTKKMTRCAYPVPISGEMADSLYFMLKSANAISNSRRMVAAGRFLLSGVAEAPDYLSTLESLRDRLELHFGFSGGDR